MSPRFHVLIIDDDRALCASLSTRITAAGFRVDCLSGTEAPHRVVRDLSPDLVILEVTSSGEGMETLRRIQLQRTTRDIPLIVTSQQSALEYELLDVFDFLPKPLDENRLMEDLALATRLGRKERTSLPPLPAGDLPLFQDYLHLHSGLHFDRGNIKLLERGLMRRMRALNLDSYRQYYEYLQAFAESRRELQKLMGLLTVGETYFFRFLPHYEALLKTVVPEVLARLGGRRPLRIWSAGCSTGEEPYSLAMLLAEHFPRAAEGQVEILATDINSQALQKARAGVYGPRALRVTEPKYRERYFRPLGSSFLLRDDIVRMVRFGYLNLQTGTYPSPAEGTADLDLLFCRNVMIYFRPETVRRIVSRFTRCLVPGGYLFLGHSETLSQITDRFTRVSQAGSFFYRLGTEKEVSLEEPPRPQALRDPDPEPYVWIPPGREEKKAEKPTPQPPPASTSWEGRPAGSEELYRLGMEAFHRENFDRAAAFFEEILLQSPGHVAALLGRGFVLANQGRYPEALACCAEVLALDDLSPEAYFLKGMVLESRDETEAALREYRRALLLDMDFVMPHYNLSRIYRRLGLLREALRELRNCLKLLEKAPRELLVPHSGGLSREVFLEVCLSELSREDAP